VADEPVPTAASPPVAPATPEPTAPAPSAGVSLSASETAPAPETPIVEPVAAPATETSAEAVAEPEAPKPAASLLTEATTIEPVAEKPAEPEAPVVAKPVYEPFTLPEGLQADNSVMGKYTEILGEHGVSQEAGQALVDLYAGELQRVSERALEHQREVFANTQKEWVAEVRAELGSRFDTTLREAAFGRDSVLLNPAFGGSQDLLNKFSELIDFTGVGNHVTFVKAFAAIGRALAEPKVPTVQPQPVADRGLGRSRAQQRYPGMGTNGAG
jgi:hypothetical protein